MIANDEFGKYVGVNSGGLFIVPSQNMPGVTEVNCEKMSHDTPISYRGNSPGLGE